jgi:molybdopterin/thiamine biosynthesis adenylyltransferase
MSTTISEAPDLSLRDIRQRDLVPPAKLSACHPLVIGVGAVGRQLALQLASTGVTRMTLVDDDHVAVENLAPQGYTPSDLGRHKVDATAAWCREIHPELVMETYAERFRRSSTRDLSCFGRQSHRLAVFCCVDTIECRRIVWESVRSQASFFADARMAAEVVRVLASDRPALDDYYRTTLFENRHAYAGSCTAKSTIYSASIAAGLMMAQFTRWLRGLLLDRDLLLNLLAGELTAA